MFEEEKYNATDSNEIFAEMLLTDNKVINDMSSYVRRCVMSIKSFAMKMEDMQNSEEIMSIINAFIKRSSYDIDDEFKQNLANFLGKCAFDLMKEIQAEEIKKLLTPSSN